MPARLSFVSIAFAAATLVAVVAAPGFAQDAEFLEIPFAENQWTYGRRLDESQLRYCVDKREPDWEVAAEIADTIAAGLLLEPRRYEVERDMRTENITKVYAIMLEHCDLHMGFKLIPQGYGDWAMLTRPYYESEYVFVSRDPGIERLGDLPPGRPIGATLGTSAHMRLVSYVVALPAESRWPAFPIGTSNQTLDALRDGTVDLALVWAPSFWARKRSDPDFADYRIISSDPLPPTALGVGGLLLSNQTFLRTAIDEAIAALTADGTIGRILEAYDFPAEPIP